LPKDKFFPLVFAKGYTNILMANQQKMFLPDITTPKSTAINMSSLVTPTLASRPLIISAKENILEQAMMQDGVLDGVLGQHPVPQSPFY